MVVKIPLRLVTLERRVGMLYKKWLRHLEGNSNNRLDYRFKARVCRHEFDYILNQKDARITKKLLLEKEAKLSSTFIYDPVPFPTSPEGANFEPYNVNEDWMLDMWHPFEKAQYPDYFARRELRKGQYLEMWEKQHGPPPPIDH